VRSFILRWTGFRRRDANVARACFFVGGYLPFLLIKTIVTRKTYEESKRKDLKNQIAPAFFGRALDHTFIAIS